MFLELMSGGKKGGVQCKETGCGGEGQAHLQENMGNGGGGSQRVAVWWFHLPLGLEFGLTRRL